MPEILAENVDRLVSIEIRPRGMPRGKASALYEAAIADAGMPLSLNAARGLIEAVSAGDRVLITCMTGGPPWLPYGETDGPPGGAAIARAISVALGAVPLVVASDPHRGPVEAAINAVGLLPVEPEIAVERSGSTGFVRFPSDPANADSWSREILDRFEPTAIVSVETLGPNIEGVVQSVTGHDMTSVIPGYYALFQQAAAREIYSLGIGDGGNEIGFGRIRPAVESIQDYGAEGQIPGKAGMATAVETDALVFAGVSNWGAAAVAAMLAFLTDTPEALHSPREEYRMIEAAAVAGAVDGRFARPTVSVDGLDAGLSVAIVEMLNAMIRVAGERVSRPF